MEIRELEIQAATVEDAPIITAHRRAMFEEMGATERAELDAMEAAFADWVREKFARDEYFGWLAVDAEGKVFASVGLWLMEWSPIPSDISGRRGRVMNVYTAPEYRRQGLARRLTIELIGWSRAHGLRFLDLDASAVGRGLYESLGFEETREMRLRLE
ncbi:MAG: GNAT family N-acetyltransferase [Anaerolineales bacterium]